jgi:FkbM family methyltransferase
MSGAHAKEFVKRMLYRLGYEIRPIGAALEFSEIWRWLRETQRIRTVIDIGAHNGDFGAFLAGFFQATSTYAFEPSRSCEAVLQEKARTVHNYRPFQLALSDREGDVDWYENSYGPASSLLRVGQISKTEFPQTATETLSRVRQARLDDILDADVLERDILIKLDVQGAEDRVIRGGRRVFAAAHCVLVEMSFVSMYDGQPLFEEVNRLLDELGFRFAGLKNQIHSAHSGQPLFAHCLYLRTADRKG